MQAKLSGPSHGLDKAKSKQDGKPPPPSPRTGPTSAQHTGRWLALIGELHDEPG